jgi:hypothetical protein
MSHDRLLNNGVSQDAKQKQKCESCKYSVCTGVEYLESHNRDE